MAEKKVDEKVSAKAAKLKAFFAENKMEMFQDQNVNDEAQTTIFRSKMAVKGQLLPFAILLDQSVYALVQVQLAPAVAVGDAFEKVSTYLNQCNNRVRMFKFTISAAGDVMLNVPMTFKDDDFNPALMNAILVEIIKFLEVEYAGFMAQVWTSAR
ncbi:MAG: hypothetical protein MJ048_01810 [Acidaminococcaceae bacterium]|nr:hypothetical protein [Acidaminococcaceae bacterium]MDO4935069.1 hypothetical protein [Phascolarctobacterium sp.]